MGMVIGFASFQLSRPHPTGESRAARPEQAAFTPRDRIDLERWSRSGRSVSFCNGELGSFAMLYEDGQLCASWGAVRQGGAVLLWNCVTLADIGRFATMTEALGALSVEDGPMSLQNVTRLVHPTALATRAPTA